MPREVDVDVKTREAATAAAAAAMLVWMWDGYISQAPDMVASNENSAASNEGFVSSVGGKSAPRGVAERERGMYRDGQRETADKGRT